MQQAGHRRGSSSLFHGLKTKVFSGKDQTSDEQFDEYKEVFDSYSEQLDSLATIVRRYEEDTTKYVKSNSKIWDTYAGLFRNSQHACTALIERSKIAHDNFGVQIVPVTLQYIQSAMDMIEVVRNEIGDLRAKIKQREKLREEFDYYRAKVADLVKDKEEVTAKGKAFKNNDKLERNLEKLTHAKDAYTNGNTQLTQELYNFLVVRYDKLRTSIMALLACERAMSKGLLNVLDTTCENDADRIIDSGVSAIMRPGAGVGTNPQSPY